MEVKKRRRGLGEHSSRCTGPNSIVCWVEHPSLQAVGRDAMVSCYPLCRDGFVERGICSKCRSGRGLGGTGKDTEEVNSSTRDEISSGEHWFNQETSSAERRAMFQLERELETTLKFEHGGGQQASPLWVTRILLGRLFKEQLALGHVVKVYAKF